MANEFEGTWKPGKAPVAVVMLTLNEGHNIAEICKNIAGWAQQVFIVDSLSQDNTVEMAIQHGIHIVQRRFTNFGDQWNFALEKLPITTPWTMKLDPDERLSDQLKNNLLEEMTRNQVDGICVTRRWWLMGKPLTITDQILRVWRTGRGRFTDVAVNEYPFIEGKTVVARGFIEHLDSPDLEHWVEKQNRYSTAEAIGRYQNAQLAGEPSIFGTSFQRRMWIKKYFFCIPGRYLLLFLYFWLWKGLWRSGWFGYASARLWVNFFFIKECKYREMMLTEKMPQQRYYGPGTPDRRVEQYE